MGVLSELAGDLGITQNLSERAPRLVRLSFTQAVIEDTMIFVLVALMIQLMDERIDSALHVVVLSKLTSMHFSLSLSSSKE